MQNAKCGISSEQNAPGMAVFTLPFCILHFAFCISPFSVAVFQMSCQEE
jgi:hypothetical protein